MSDRYFWTKDHNVLVIHSGNNIFKNDENLLELNDTEVRLHLNPPKPPTTMEQVKQRLQNFCDSIAITSFNTVTVSVQVAMEIYSEIILLCFNTVTVSVQVLSKPIHPTNM